MIALFYTSFSPFRSAKSATILFNTYLHVKKVNFHCTQSLHRWASLNYSRLLKGINSELESAESEWKILNALLDSGKISSTTYERINGGLFRITENMRGLKESLEQEEDLLRSELGKQVKVLERVLADLKFHYLSGEYNAEECELMQAILTSGIDSIKGPEGSSIHSASRPSPLEFLEPTLLKEASHLEDSFESSLVKENDVKNGSVGHLNEMSTVVKRTNSSGPKSERMNSRRSIKSRKKTKRESMLDAHCRNPWNGDCRNTDIELSIYYDGEFLPICHKCWQEISNRNLEWSGF